jgi:hypothetical protein
MALLPVGSRAILAFSWRKSFSDARLRKIGGHQWEKLFPLLVARLFSSRKARLFKPQGLAWRGAGIGSNSNSYG